MFTKLKHNTVLFLTTIQSNNECVIHVQSELSGDELRRSELSRLAARRLAAKCAANGPNASEGKQNGEWGKPFSCCPFGMRIGFLKRLKFDPGNAGRNPGYGFARSAARFMTLAAAELVGYGAGCWWWPDLRWWSLDPFANEWMSRESRTVSIPEINNMKRVNEWVEWMKGRVRRKCGFLTVECSKVES